MSNAQWIIAYAAGADIFSIIAGSRPPPPIPLANVSTSCGSASTIFFNVLSFCRSRVRILCFLSRFLTMLYSFSNRSLPISRKKWKWQMKSGTPQNTVSTADKMPLPISWTKAIGSPYCRLISLKNGMSNSAFSEGSLILSKTIWAIPSIPVKRCGLSASQVPSICKMYPPRAIIACLNRRRLCWCAIAR